MSYPINSIEINRFRGLGHLEIKKFSRINIFLRKNNVGKTSILEAIFLLTGMSNPTLPSLVNAIRGGGSTKIEDLSWLFYNKDINKPISISDGISRAIQVEPVFGLENGSGSTPTYSSSGVAVKGLKCLFHHEKKGGTVSFLRKRML